MPTQHGNAAGSRQLDPVPPLWQASSNSSGLALRHHSVSRATLDVESSSILSGEAADPASLVRSESNPPVELAEKDDLAAHGLSSLRRLLSESRAVGMGAVSPLRYSPAVGLRCRKIARSSYEMPATGRGIVMYDEVWTLSEAECQLRAAFRLEATAADPELTTTASRPASRRRISSCMTGSGAVVEEEVALRFPRRAAYNAIQGARFNLETVANGLARNTGQEGQGL